MEPVPSGTSLRRLATALLLTTIALTSTAVLAGCGRDAGGQDVEGLLDRAFRHSIHSADLKIDANLTLSGLKGFERPLRLEAAGPYIGGGRALPKLDIDINVGAQGAGQTVQFGLLRTGSRAFVKFGGEFYEQPRSEVDRANRELDTGRGRPNGPLRDLGLAPRTWVVGARDEGDQKIAGVDAHHVSGTLDIRSLLRDLNELVQRSGTVVGRTQAEVPEPLSAQELDTLAETVRNPSFDVYVGKDDELIRRVSAQLEVRVPKEDRAGAGGLEDGALRFSVEFRDLDGGQVVAAPAKARPIADLTKQLGGLGTLGGLGALEGDPGANGDPGGAPPAPRGRGERAGSGATTGGEQGSGGVEAFQRCSDCLDKAGPDDTKALSRCRKLLR